MIRTMLLWLLFAVVVLYLADAAWRFWRHRPERRWTPLWVEVLIPLVLVLNAFNATGAVSLRIVCVISAVVGAILRILNRRRFHIPAWPPV